jgi:hypothetical protein
MSTNGHGSSGSKPLGEGDLGAAFSVPSPSTLEAPAFDVSESYHPAFMFEAESPLAGFDTLDPEATFDAFFGPQTTAETEATPADDEPDLSTMKVAKAAPRVSPPLPLPPAE